MIVCITDLQTTNNLRFENECMWSVDCTVTDPIFHAELELSFLAVSLYSTCQGRSLRR